MHASSSALFRPSYWHTLSLKLPCPIFAMSASRSDIAWSSLVWSMYIVQLKCLFPRDQLGIVVYCVLDIWWWVVSSGQSGKWGSLEFVPPTSILSHPGGTNAVRACVLWLLRRSTHSSSIPLSHLSECIRQHAKGNSAHTAHVKV